MALWRSQLTFLKPEKYSVNFTNYHSLAETPLLVNLVKYNVTLNEEHC